MERESGEIQLYIKIWSEQDACLLYLTNVNHEPNLIAFTLAPSHDSLSIKYKTALPFLQIPWTRKLPLYINGVLERITLPQKIPIPHSLLKKIKKIIIKEDVHSAVLWHYRDSKNYLEIPQNAVDITNPPIMSLFPITKDNPTDVYITPPSHIYHPHATHHNNDSAEDINPADFITPITTSNSFDQISQKLANERNTKQLNTLHGNNTTFLNLPKMQRSKSVDSDSSTQMTELHDVEFQSPSIRKYSFRKA